MHVAQRMNRRLPLVAIAAAVALLLAAGVLLSTGVGPFSLEDDEAPVYNAASALEGGPDEVLFVSGTTLIRRDVEANEETAITDVPSPNVYAAPGSTWLAYVTSKATVGNTAVPVLEVYDTETESKQRIGPGVRPAWNAEGTQVAFVRPLVPTECLGEDCAGDVKIGFFDVATGDTSVVLVPGRYSILGWAGDRVLVSDFENKRSILALSPEGERIRLRIAAEEFIAASPVGEWILTQQGDVTEFIPLDAEGLGDERIAVELGEYEVLEAEFAHDATRVAAITGITAGVPVGNDDDGVIEIGKEATTTQIQVFSPESPEPVLVEETFGAAGHLLWSVDNESVIFSRLLDPKKALFQANHCPVANEGECTVVTSWTEGVAILRAE